MTSTQRSDHDVKIDVIDELRSLALNSDHIGVAVDAGVVILSGQVDSHRERYCAEQGVLGLSGVAAVAEELSVRGQPETVNTTIARKATLALAQAADVPPHSVRVVVRNQVVTLTGSMRWDFQRQAAERAVGCIAGVEGIQNRVSVAESTHPVVVASG